MSKLVSYCHSTGCTFEILYRRKYFHDTEKKHDEWRIKIMGKTVCVNSWSTFSGAVERVIEYHKAVGRGERIPKAKARRGSMREQWMIDAGLVRVTIPDYIVERGRG